jgi:YjjG family noncanonical pyrimidine nucleotidase
MRYPTLLMDLDHTLLDSETSELAAFEHTMQVAGVSEPDRYLDPYLKINRAMWAAVERHELTPLQVRNARFERFVAEMGVDADPNVLADAFVEGLGASGELYPGAREVLDELVPSVTLALVTNGLAEVQRARIARLDIEAHFAAIVISGEVGVAKPGAPIYDLTFDALGGPPKSGVLMVGDSLSSDMAGGRNYGIATCWYNPASQPSPSNGLVTHEIADLALLPELAATGSLA